MGNAITKSICCDVLLPIKNYKRFIYLLTKATESPKWLRHAFIVMTYEMSDEDLKVMTDWYYQERVKKTMPEVVFIPARGDVKELTKLYSLLLLAADNPFVYLQHENDELPVNIDKAIHFLYNNPNVDIAMGKCETFIDSKTPIEVFPLTTIKGEFIYDSKIAMKLFPSYFHPLASVIRKSVFDKVAYYDKEKEFKAFAYYYFILRCIEQKNVNIEYVPYTLKISNRKKENAITMSNNVRKMLIHDISLWVDEFADSEFKTFQKDILKLLQDGSITTFKEIDARIEEYIDDM